MNELLKHLEAIKEYISEEAYNKAVVSLVVNYWKKELRRKYMFVHQTELMDRVNLTLRSLGIEEVSYYIVGLQ